ncbi:sensor histidine kinase [Anaerobacterium chartisolvens]|nr:histidine kinase [Anaerobacterium chartisolvens]
MKQIDSSLDVVDSYLSTMAASDPDLQILNLQYDEDSRLVSTANLSSKLGKDILAYRSMDCIFIYNTVSEDFIYGMGESESFSERDRMKTYITDLINNDPKVDAYLYPKGWRTEKINEQYYLMRLFKSDTSYVGAWVRVKKLLFPLNFINMGNGGASMLTTADGIPMTSSNDVTDENVDLTKSFNRYYLTGTRNQYLLVGANSTKGDFNLVALIQDNKILENLPVLQHVINTIAFGSILLLPLSLILLHRVVMVPINRIISAMKKIRDGNIEVRIKKYKTSDEFKLVNDTFNTMLDEIHDLKINVYEEKLSKQKAELEHLQLQVNPHFFLNSLNIIYRMAQTRRYDLIQEMSLCLLQYFRYMFKNNLKFVALKDELQHVRNYIRIQELRFPGNLTYEVKAEEFLLEQPIPPLAIQNFVENSVKYAVSLDEPVHLCVNVQYKKIDGLEFMKIIISDSGKGFSEEVLKELREGRRVVDEQGEHVGVWNVQRRLELLYSGEAAITFSNGEKSGARVEMEVPLKTAFQLADEKINAENGEGSV